MRDTHPKAEQKPTNTLSRFFQFALLTSLLAAYVFIAFQLVALQILASTLLNLLLLALPFAAGLYYLARAVFIQTPRAASQENNPSIDTENQKDTDTHLPSPASTVSLTPEMTPTEEKNAPHPEALNTAQIPETSKHLEQPVLVPTAEQDNLSKKNRLKISPRLTSEAQRNSTPTKDKKISGQKRSDSPSNIDEEQESKKIPPATTPVKSTPPVEEADQKPPTTTQTEHNSSTKEGGMDVSQASIFKAGIGSRKNNKKKALSITSKESALSPEKTDQKMPGAEDTQLIVNAAHADQSIKEMGSNVGTRSNRRKNQS